MAIDCNGVKIEDRPFDQVREEAIDQLIMNYSHGKLSAEAFERRLDLATNATQHQELVDVVADLTLEPDKQYEQQRERSFSPQYQSGNDTQHERIISVLSSNQHNGQWLVPAEIQVISILGSVELDFSEAIFQHQHVVIRVNNWVGSLDILVPEQVNVVSNMFNIIGSANNKAPSMGGRQAPKIVIEGYSILGSLEVKLKRTMKEKFSAFANQCRDMFGLGKQ
ncbi:LiaF-related protein [Alkalimonas collagenimarina]|uniref:LiaF-related protein n=1 Tax=Alkalimonas collagenimarina TaxID=400390 RepID=A0ABT9GWY6_9GAMM|nr:LiaF domain-containing protein [Alkalimonas collagenimarina]MDP4535478.1 LiaF-related protein [Alkalimonas collagenimarina]